MGVVDAERLDGFGVAGSGAVNGDEMKDTVVAFAVHGKANAHRHGGDGRMLSEQTGCSQMNVPASFKLVPRLESEKSHGRVWLI